jgi:cellulose synthase/poly-beta-1,6-N-acetylglucosamine synthase-like glycosyltransferase
MTQWVFWGAVAGLAWTFIGYPAGMLARARFAPAPSRREHAAAGSEPTVTVVLAVRNAEAGIADRLRNLLEQAYPPERLDVVVVCNGCADGTEQAAQQVAAAAGGRVRVLTSPAAEAKGGALNAGVAAARGEILVFADARQRFDARAVAELAAAFDDPHVGAVSGRLVIGETSASGGVYAVARYWDVETRLRLAESRTGSVVGTTGAIYAMRRTLYEPVPPAIILDDVYLPMRVVAQGFRVTLNPRAIAYDTPSTGLGAEYRRRVRTMVGNLEILRLMPELLVPWRNRIFARYLSHKVLRVLAPALCVALLGSALLLRGPLHLPVAAALAGVYVLGGVGLVRPSRALALPTAFVLLHTAALSALLRPRRRSSDLWG